MGYKFTEVHPYEKGFEQYFQTKLVPLFEKVERHRRAALSKFIFMLIGCIVLTLIVLAFCFSYLDVDFEIILGVLVTAIMISTWFLKNTVDAFKIIAKTKVNDLIVKFFGKFEYFYESGISETKIDATELMLPDYDFILYDDYIKGQHKGNIIEISEVDLREEYVGLDGEDDTRSVFNGIFIILSFSGNFAGKTYIIDKPKDYKKAFYNKYSAFKKLIRKFEIRYNVYTNNPQECSLILDTVLQNKIIELASNFGCSSLNCGIFANKVIFAISVDRDLFESVSLFRPAYNEYRLKSILKDIYLILELSEFFNDKVLHISKQNSDINEKNIEKSIVPVKQEVLQTNTEGKKQPTELTNKLQKPDSKEAYTYYNRGFNKVNDGKIKEAIVDFEIAKKLFAEAGNTGLCTLSEKMIKDLNKRL